MALDWSFSADSDAFVDYFTSGHDNGHLQQEDQLDPDFDANWLDDQMAYFSSLDQPLFPSSTVNGQGTADLLRAALTWV